MNPELIIPQEYEALQSFVAPKFEEFLGALWRRHGTGREPSAWIGFSVRGTHEGIECEMGFTFYGTLEVELGTKNGIVYGTCEVSFLHPSIYELSEVSDPDEVGEEAYNASMAAFEKLHKEREWAKVITTFEYTDDGAEDFVVAEDPFIASLNKARAQAQTNAHFLSLFEEQKLSQIIAPKPNTGVKSI